MDYHESKTKEILIEHLTDFSTKLSLLQNSCDEIRNTQNPYAATEHYHSEFVKLRNEKAKEIYNLIMKKTGGII